MKLKWVLGYTMIIAVSLLAVSAWNQAVSVFSEQIPVRRQHSIVIDAGHGGVDGGAVSCTGVPESRLNLEISIRLNDLFRFFGYSTKMIRSEDVSVYKQGDTISQKKISDLKERVKIVNSGENNILVSIHQNTFSQAEYAGAQVFYAKASESHTMAKKLQSNLNDYLETGHRKEKKAEGIYLMEHIIQPGVLIECGFLSNPAEEARLRNAAYQKRLCSVIACTLHEILSNT